MKFWSRAPLLRVALPLIAGILCSDKFVDTCESTYILPGLILVIVTIIQVKKIIWNQYFRIFAGIGIVAFMFYFGVFVVKYHQAKGVGNFASNQSNWILEVGSPSVLKNGKVSFTAHIRSPLPYEDSKIQCFLKNDLACFKIGDILAVSAKIEVFKAPTNPNVFHYRAYMIRKGFDGIMFANSSKDITLLYSTETFSFNRFATKWRMYFLSKIELSNLSELNKSILKALVLGQKEDLEEGVRIEYAVAGTSHILAVSGLHVGIIYLVLCMVFRMCENRKWFGLLRVICILCLLWLYAMITGFSPSVVRSVVMFSMVLVGSSLKRKVNIYNTLSGSAIFILLYDPMLIYDVGFQLSYIAVFGIVYIQPKIHNWLIPSNRLFDKIWSIISVSLAAQLVTAPLSIYLFHQFPNYFLLSNLLVIPVITLVLYGGIVLCVLPSGSTPSLVDGSILNSLLDFMNGSVNRVANLPFAVTENLQLTLFELISIYIALFFFLGWLSNKRAVFLLMILVMILAIINYETLMTTQQTNSIRVYDMRKSVIVEFNSNNHTFQYRNAVDENSDEYVYNVLPSVLHRRFFELSIIKTGIRYFEDNLDFAGYNGSYFFRNKLILFYDSKYPAFDPYLVYDIIILADPADLIPTRLIEKWKTAQFVLCTSIKTQKRIKMKMMLADLNVWDIAEQGFFELEIE